VIVHPALPTGVTREADVMAHLRPDVTAVFANLSCDPVIHAMLAGNRISVAMLLSGTAESDSSGTDDDKPMPASAGAGAPSSSVVLTVAQVDAELLAVLDRDQTDVLSAQLAKSGL